MAVRTQYGYVLQVKGTNMFLTCNGNTLGVPGDQSRFYVSDRIRFFLKKTRKGIPASGEYKQAMKEGNIVTLFNHNPKDKKTLNKS